MPPDQHDDPSDTRPYLSIPYWTAPLLPGGAWDTGQDRPLPGAVPSYLCESIQTSAYQPGMPLDVRVNVRNSGGGNSTALATVVVYWAVPSVGFAHPTFFAATVVAVPPGRGTASVVTSATMTATIPASAPGHICLVVAVSHPQDKAGTACDPVHDRHWAQRNLLAVAAGAGAPAIVPMMVNNPYAEALTFALQAGPVDERQAHRVAAAVQTQPSGVRPRVRLLDEQGAALSDAGEATQASLQLGALEQRALQVMIELDTDLPAGRSAAVELTLAQTQHDRGVVGSLGVVVVPTSA